MALSMRSSGQLPAEAMGGFTQQYLAEAEGDGGMSLWVCLEMRHPGIFMDFNGFQ